MRADDRLLIIDKNTERAGRLQVSLGFMGEKAEIVSSDECKKLIQPKNDILAIIIGDQGKAPGLENTLKVIHELNPNLPFFVIKQAISMKSKKILENAVYDIIDEPFQYHEMLRVLHHAQMAKENVVREKPEERLVPLFRSMVGRSAAMQETKNLLRQVAGTEATVLLLGESGTGKEVAARNLHRHSSRKEKHFVAVNCGAIPHDLLESELFGHEKGAFTGAYSTKQGRFELAQGGTLFLDEIGDMPLAMQVKLLRVLQEKSFTRVGSGKEIQTDVRVIAATHRNLKVLIKSEKFRQDLYYRLNVFPIEIPALRDRMEDIPLLINELVARIEGQKRSGVKFLPEAVDCLLNYEWPGNVRELANFVERMAIIKPDGIVHARDLPEKFHPKENQCNGNPIDLSKQLEKTEANLIMQVLAETDNDIAQAAELLSMREDALKSKIHKYGLPQTN